MLQKKLISKGYAKVAYLYDDYKYVDLLKKEEETAKKNKLGVWSDKEYVSSNSNEESLLDSVLDKIFSYIRKAIKNML